MRFAPACSRQPTGPFSFNFLILDCPPSGSGFLLANARQHPDRQVYITTSPYHHFTTSPHHHIITSSHHHIITSSPHHIITPSHHHTITPSHHHTITSSHHHPACTTFVGSSTSSPRPINHDVRRFL